MSASDLERLTINTIRTLAMDAVQAAKSGHPGTPMAMAPVVYCLWQEFLRFDPDDPIWPNRDRFVLSMGHASMLLYSMLALAGVKAVNAKYERLGQLAVTLDDIKRFRQLDSKAPGHPEYRWNVTRVGDANDLDMLRRALRTFHQTTDRPTLIIVDSHIAYGAPNKQDTSAAHGEPLGEEEIRLTKRTYDWPEDTKFLVPDGVREHVASGVGRRGRALRDAWFASLEHYRQSYPELAEQVYRMQHRQLPDGWDRDLPSFPADPKGLAGRDASAQVLNVVAKNVPWLIGGSADLAPSTKTRLTFPDAGDLTAESPGGRNLHFGIREHAMGAVLNGLSLSKVRPFGSGFLIFSDYGRPALRLAALMEVPVIYVFTHDSIGVGEDGPTHQPIEQLASLRAIPGLITLRPADANEVREAWRVILQLRHVPAALVVSRQPLPTLDRSRYASAAGVAHGAYVLADAEGDRPDVLLLGTGSEVALCVQAHERLSALGVRSRVVSMPSWELFEQQPRSYRDGVIPTDVTARVSVEQASGFGWDRYVGPEGARIGMETFGASAPLQELQKKFGFTVEHVVAAARAQLERKGVGSHAS